MDMTEKEDINEKLLNAARRGYLAQVKDLLSRGADVNYQTFYGDTALHRSSVRGHPEVCRVLIDSGADVNYRHENGRTLLHEVCRRYLGDSSTTIQLLLDAGLRPDARDEGGDTPMHLACNLDDTSIIEKFLDTGILLDIANKKGKTPLHYACENKDNNFAEILLRANFRTEVKDQDGNTPFDLSKVEGSEKLRHKFKKYKSKFADIPKEIKGKNALKIFKKALKRGQVQVFHIRIMIVGHFGVGKSTVTKVLLKDIANLCNLSSTDGIDIYIGRCHINLDTGEWEQIKLGDYELTRISQRMKQLLYDERRQEVMESPKSKLFAAKPKESTIPKIKPDASSRTIPDIKTLPKQHFVTASGSPSRIGSSTQKSKIKNTLHLSGADLDHLKPNQHKLLSLSKAEETLGGFAEKYCNVEIWDFGGQAAFYTSHQAFLSPRCLYPLVIDASKDMDDTVDDDELIPGLRSSVVVKEYVNFWVNVIIYYATGKDEGFPKIIPVLTHLDLIPEEKREGRIQQIFKAMQEHFSGQKAEKHMIYDHRLSLNALDPFHVAYGYLREIIFNESKAYSSFGEYVPSSWLLLEYALYNMRTEGIKIARVSLLQSLFEGGEFPAIDNEEILSFLDFQHSLGYITYYKEKGLRDYIILHPKWLIDALRSLITADRFYRGDETKAKMLAELSSKGIISWSAIDQLWKRAEYAELYKFKSHVLSTMEKLDLLASSFHYNEEGGVIKEQKYFVPSMVKGSVHDELLQELVPANASSCLLYTFEGKFLPKAIFNRLTASCINMWPIEIHESATTLYAGFCCFRVDSFHTIAIRMLSFQILLSVAHRNKGISKGMCIEVMNFITEELQRICHVHRQIDGENEKEEMKNKMFKIHIPCCGQHLDCTINFDDSKTGVSHLCHHHPGKKDTFESPFAGFETTQSEISKFHCEAGCKGLDESVCKNEISERDLARIARRLCQAPDMLAAYFNWSEEPEWEDIKFDEYFGPTEKRFLLLLKWQRKFGMRATFGKLMKTIVKFGDTFGDNTLHCLCEVSTDQYLFNRDAKYIETIKEDRFPDIKAAFLDLYINIENNKILTKIDDKRDYSGFPIVNFSMP